jgi:hypothetical protein
VRNKLFFPLNNSLFGNFLIEKTEKIKNFYKNKLFTFSKHNSSNTTNIKAMSTTNSEAREDV